MTEAHDDFAVEPVPGLPEMIPDSERMLWQGAPDWMSLARRALHVRKVLVYFGVLAVWVVGNDIHDGKSALAVIQSALWLAAFAAAAAVILGAIAWGIARTTIYTLTSRRLVMRFGIALPMTVNYPFKLVHSADLRMFPDGTGDLSLAVEGKDKIAYVILWPHARPWHLNAPRPMLRCVKGAEAVADILAEALAAYASQPGIAEGSAIDLAPARPGLLPGRPVKTTSAADRPSAGPQALAC